MKSGGHDAAVDDDLHFAGDEGVVATNRAWAAEEPHSMLFAANSMLQFGTCTLRLVGMKRKGPCPSRQCSPL